MLVVDDRSGFALQFAYRTAVNGRLIHFGYTIDNMNLGVHNMVKHHAVKLSCGVMTFSF